MVRGAAVIDTTSPTAPAESKRSDQLSASGSLHPARQQQVSYDALSCSHAVDFVDSVQGNSEHRHVWEVLQDSRAAAFVRHGGDAGGSVNRELDKSGIHVAEYLTTLPPRAMLIAQLQIGQRAQGSEGR